jgi:hypothetical protein
VILLGAAVLAGMVAGRLCGGGWQGLGSLRVRWPWLPVAALGLQVAIGAGPLRGPGAGRAVLLGSSYSLVGTWIWLNALACTGPLRWALVAVAEGWLLNVLVMVANGGMPVSNAALARIGHAGATVSNGHLWKHVVVSPATRIPLLGDVVPIPIPLLRSVVSVGDLVMLAGISVAVAVVMIATRQRVAGVHLAPAAA